MTGAESNGAPGRPLVAPSEQELPPLVARSPLGIFDEAMTMLRIRPQQLLLIATLIVVPTKAIAALVPGSSIRRARPEQIADLLLENVIGVDSVAANIVSFGFESLGLFFLGVMYAELGSAWFVGQAPTTKEVFARTFRRSHKLLLVWFCAKAVLVFSGFLSLGVAAVLVGTMLAVLAPILGAERMKLREAMQRSANLASAKLGQTGLVYVMTGVGAMLIRFAIKQSPSVILGQIVGDNQPPDWLVYGITEVVGSVFAAAFLATASFVLYLDLRIRREGIDLDLAIGRTFPSNISRNISRDAGAGRG